MNDRMVMQFIHPLAALTNSKHRYIMVVVRRARAGHKRIQFVDFVRLTLFHQHIQGAIHNGRTFNPKLFKVAKLYTRR